MSLQDYKLFYEGKVKVGNNYYKVIYASTSGVPSDGDTKLTYKLTDGTEITDAQINDNYHFFYEKLKQIVFGSTSRTQIPSISDAQINVYVGDDLIFGTPLYTVTVSNDSVELTSLKVNGENFTSGDVALKGSIVSITKDVDSTEEYSASITIGSTTTPIENWHIDSDETIWYEGSFELTANTTITVTLIEEQNNDDEQQDS